MLATGYAAQRARTSWSRFRDRIRWDDQGRFAVAAQLRGRRRPAARSSCRTPRSTRTAHRARPRHGRVPQLVDHRRDARPRGLPGREADRLPGVRRARPAAVIGRVTMSIRDSPRTARPGAATLACCTRWVTHPALRVLDDAGRDVARRRPRRVRAGSPPTRTTTRCLGLRRRRAGVPRRELRPGARRCSPALPEVARRRRRHALPRRAARRPPVHGLHPRRHAPP